MKLTDIRLGDVLTYWHADGLHGQLCYARVVRVNRVTVAVETEYGGVRRAYPTVFSDKVGTGSWHPWLEKRA